ncbi:MAG: hypothetical protein Q8S13_10590 [Dehalococcoidia bacterium]|nr:hypothetical protein [Dehalococcoidia bacterium]
MSVKRIGAWFRRSSRPCTIPREVDRVEAAILYARHLGFDPKGMSRDLGKVYKLARAGRCLEMGVPLRRARRAADRIVAQAARSRVW